MTSKKKVTFIVAGVVVVIIAVLAVIFAVTSRKTKIDLNECVSIYCDGYDTMGTASHSFNGERIIKSMDVDLEFSNEMQAYNFIEAVDKAVRGNLDRSVGLSNGDTITYKWDVEKDELEKIGDKYGCEFVYSDISYVVEGLEAFTEYNPFEELEITYTGVDGYGEVEITAPETTHNNISLYYTVEESGSLRNGDKVVVKVNSRSSDDVQAYCLQKGIKLTEVEKEYTVEGLLYYLYKVSDIPENVLEAWDRSMKDIFAEKEVANWDEAFSYTQTLIGEAIFIKKETLWDDARHTIACAYRIDTISKEGNPFSYYYYVLLYDTFIDDKGEISGAEYYDVPSGSVGFFGPVGEAFEKDGLIYVGFETLDELINALEGYSTSGSFIDSNIAE